MPIVCCIGVVYGVTQLGDIVYVVCARSSVIKTFTDTLSPLADIHVKGMKDPRDMVVSHDDRQLYVADWPYGIWRVSVDDHRYVKWLTTDPTTDTFHVNTLSVTSRRLLVTSWDPPRLVEYSTTDKELLRVVDMPSYVRFLYHGVETTRGTFVVGHYGTGNSQNERQHAVSELCPINIA